MKRPQVAKKPSPHSGSPRLPASLSRPQLRGAERRQHRRIDIQLEVAFATEQAFVTEYTRNISLGGIFLKTDRLPDRNAHIELHIKLPNHTNPVRVIGQVVRTVSVSNPTKPGEHLHGIGIVFVDFPDGSKAAFDAFYQKLVAVEGGGEQEEITDA